MASEDDLFRIVWRSVAAASETLDRLELSRKFAALRERTEVMVQNLHKHRNLHVGDATQAWCAILFVDLRGSTNRAERMGPAATYLTMHALLPALAFLVADMGGYIVGFRGDGLFACFGIDETGVNPSNLDKPEVLVNSALCGQAMVEGVARVVNPILDTIRCEGNLIVGIGIDVGDVIFTKIGLTNANEVTAYADAVNKAAKRADSSTGYPHLSNRAYDLYPKSQKGTVKLTQTSSGHKVVFPYPVLKPGLVGKTILEMARER